jgi:hypothetical protein
MMLFLVFLIVLPVILALLAARWGVDSRNGVNGPAKLF